MCAARAHDIIFIAEGEIKIMSSYALGMWPWGGYECEGVAMGRV